MAASDPAGFSQPLDRTTALYFTMTVLATVGFGDIALIAMSGAFLGLTFRLFGDWLKDAFGD